MNKKQISGLAGVVLFVSGCASVAPLNPGAENVAVVTTPPSAQCHYIDHLVRTDINGVTSSFTSHAKLQANEIVTLRNEAQALGGNVFVVTEHYTTYVTRPDYARVDTHMIAGDVYSCPTSVVK